MSDHYFNPDAPPEEVVKQKEEKKQTIKVRFRTLADLLKFSKDTGIPVSKLLKKMKYPMKESVDDFFD